MCSETSPRISFSNDLGEENDREIEQESRKDTSLLNSNSEFEFSICSSIGQESSSADELFADGMILPVQIQERIPASVAKQMRRHEKSHRNVSLPPLPCPSTNKNPNKESMKELVVVNSELDEKPQFKSFWGFKRSSSLNYDIKRSLCSLPLLSRSNSTGSVPSTRRTTSLKDTHKKNNSQKQQFAAANARSSSSSTYIHSLPQKPQLKKNGSYGNNNGVRIVNPVLNVSPPYIYKGTANLFGLGSFLRNGKEKKNRKVIN